MYFSISGNISSFMLKYTKMFQTLEDILKQMFEEVNLIN